MPASRRSDRAMSTMRSIFHEFGPLEFFLDFKKTAKANESNASVKSHGLNTQTCLPTLEAPPTLGKKSRQFSDPGAGLWTAQKI